MTAARSSALVAVAAAALVAFANLEGWFAVLAWLVFGAALLGLAREGERS